MSGTRREQRREIQLLSSESRWLQKALFALQKAEVAREKLADHRGQEEDDFVLPLKGKKLPVDDFQEALEDRIHEILEGVRERRRTLR